MDMLEHILDGREEPTNLPFALLKNITDNFSEEREIGQGGFGTVYKGVLPNGNVAVKRIMNSHTIDENLFYGEVNSLLKVNHQNVVRFLGYCANTEQIAVKLDGAREYIYAEIRERLFCFEYISNGSLQKHITDESSGLEWDMRYEMIKGICTGLHFLHEKCRIVHLDLKPENILMDTTMIPKISDFGLSKIFGSKQSRIITNHCTGSRGYMAPEYSIQGIVSMKADIFSLGVIIIEIITGHRDYPSYRLDSPQSTSISFQQYRGKVR
ncbi:unnamed protein product [Triticum turgidum subsp. durum]|uniref:Protein kinase domain-containing protein n=1 Tax=Triticum turgidum subsp. durum TaxID=4567 RepID=A0A9R1ACQ6_TRITD|nr:unnamed protein product [Triticum turgidum subsp. durum]